MIYCWKYKRSLVFINKFNFLRHFVCKVGELKIILLIYLLVLFRLCLWNEKRSLQSTIFVHNLRSKLSSPRDSQWTHGLSEAKSLLLVLCFNNFLPAFHIEVVEVHCSFNKLLLVFFLRNFKESKTSCHGFEHFFIGL